MSALLQVQHGRIAGGTGESTCVRVLPRVAEKAERVSSRERAVGLASTEQSTLASAYDRHAHFVYRLALRLLRSREEAEDVTQDVFATLCGSVSAYDPGGGPSRAFLSAMTRWRAIDRLRSRGRSARLLETWPEAAPFGAAPSMPSEDASMRSAAERVRGALAGLPASHREVLEMAYYRGLSQQEIAAELDAPLGTVKSWSRRALHALGERLEELRPETAPGGEPHGTRARSGSPLGAGVPPFAGACHIQYRGELEAREG